MKAEPKDPVPPVMSTTLPFRAGEGTGETIGGRMDCPESSTLVGMSIPYGRQSIDDDDIAAVVQVLRGDWLTQGPTVTEFEEAFARACDAPYAVAFSSGTAALHGAAFAAGVGPGDELVTSAMTFAASANCGAYLG